MLVEHVSFNSYNKNHPHTNTFHISSYSINQQNINRCKPKFIKLHGKYIFVTRVKTFMNIVSHPKKYMILLPTTGFAKVVEE